MVMSQKHFKCLIIAMGHNIVLFFFLIMKSKYNLEELTSLSIVGFKQTNVHVNLKFRRTDLHLWLLFGIKAAIRKKDRYYHFTSVKKRIIFFLTLCESEPLRICSKDDGEGLKQPEVDGTPGCFFL